MMDFIFPVSTGTSHIFKTGTQRSEYPVFTKKTAPCRDSCPLRVDIPAAIDMAAKGDLKGALAIYLLENPIPGVTGRVCYHPCEASCNRSSFDEPLGLRAIERAIAEHEVMFEKAVSPKRMGVAVVGSGPAGLACAFYCARHGYRVTLFERRDLPGGMLRYGIPPYRLPRTVLDRELARIFAVGIELRLKSVPSKDDLARFDAVFYAPGLPVARRLFDDNPVATGLEFLADPPSVAREHVLVIGGGNVGIDVARTCVRLDAAAVTLLSPEQKDAMPALPEEVREAHEEGINLVCGYAPLRLEHPSAPRRRGHNALVVHAGPVEVLQEPYRIIPKEGLPVSFDIDRVIVAIGQRADEMERLSGPQIRSGGDFSGARPFVADALASGRDGAHAIIAFLEGPQSKDEPLPVVTYEELNTLFFTSAPRVTLPVLPLSARRRDFAEVHGTLDPAALQVEIDRCFRCGTCVDCALCQDFCPDISIITGKPFYTFDEEHCKGCGVCATACPRHVIEMKEEAR